MNNNEINDITNRLSKIEAVVKKKSLFFWIAAFSFLMSIIAICGAFILKDVVIVNESIVLIFVGILTTIIVVSNYMQVYTAKQEFEKKAIELQQKIDNLGSIDDKIEQAKKSIEIEAAAQRFVSNTIYKDLEKKIEKIIAEKEADALIGSANERVNSGNYQGGFNLCIATLRVLCALKKDEEDWHENIYFILSNINDLLCQNKDKISISLPQKGLLHRLKDDFREDFPDLFHHIG